MVESMPENISGPYSLNNNTNLDSLEHKVLIEQIQLLYHSMVPLLVVNLLVSSILVYALWDVVAQTTLIIWMGLMIIMLLGRAVIYFIYRRRFKPQQVKSYGFYFSIGSAAGGLIWGLGGAFLLPLDNLEYQLLILFVLLGMGVGSTSSLYVYLPAFFAFFPILILPAVIKLIYIGDTIQLSLAVMISIYAIAISIFSMSSSRTMKQSLKLGFENTDLIEQLRKQKIEADNANRAKSKFLAAASHDLRQPLYALTLFTSTLDELIRYPEVRKVVQQIMTSVTSMKGLFNALLDISQFDAGVIKPDKTNFRLAPLFDTLANDFNPQATAKGLSIIWPRESFAVHSDRELLERILRNLVANAIRYTRKGCITVSGRIDSNNLIIDVEDTGIGIAAENQESIFDEYNQLENQQRDRQKGLGLGLAIVRRCALLLEHPIALVSETGKGSTFSITLPRAELDDCNFDPDPSVVPALNNSGDSLILIIDDETTVRAGSQALFESWGCNVITAFDKEDALNKIRQHKQRPNGIIADYRLRGSETGVDAIHAIHMELGDKIPALIVTGDIAVERLQDVANSGFQMLHKPVEALKLRTFLRNLQRPKAG